MPPIASGDPAAGEVRVLPDGAWIESRRMPPGWTRRGFMGRGDVRPSTPSTFGAIASGTVGLSMGARLTSPLTSYRPSLVEKARLTCKAVPFAAMKVLLVGTSVTCRPLFSRNVRTAATSSSVGANAAS